MNKVTHTHIFLVLLLVASPIFAALNITKLSPSSCDFLYQDDLRCESDEMTPDTGDYCGTLCQRSDDSIYCTSDFCGVDRPYSITDPDNCADYSGGKYCRVCIHRGCSVSEDNFDCLTEGSKMYSRCDSYTMTNEDCQSVYRNWAECNLDESCEWAWPHGGKGPGCFINEKYNSSNANIYPSDGEIGAKLCEMRENCDLCQEAGCSWCHDSKSGAGYCVYDQASTNNQECLFTVLDSDEICPSNSKQNKNCDEYKTCTECKNQDSCSWCTLNERSDEGKCIISNDLCESPHILISKDNECISELQTECNQITDCEDCITFDSCDWCVENAITKTGKCMYKYNNDSINECKTQYSGEWASSTCPVVSICDSLECEQCSNEGACEYCYTDYGEFACVGQNDCQKYEGIIVNNCNKSNYNVYDCSAKKECNDCFSEFPWCQWRYTGETYQDVSCAYWDDPIDSNTRFFDAIDCEEFVICENRLDCDSCIKNSDNFPECIWCESGDKGSCYEIIDKQYDVDCSAGCVKTYDDESNSKSSQIVLNLFLSLFSIIFYFYQL
ncbi:hypothetical protein M0812_06683 [Anaeramoeba flamelloides]|uniref:PSI domain-containing protein n=1 Tax=Anaeramoeba flamelloides TaxID=1746091 RepID=A0AAV8ACI2_9EUKA|nr:hypothetical protein M0812_06683 [Anaeramoeba flamelloides]